MDARVLKYAAPGSEMYSVPSNDVSNSSSLGNEDDIDISLLS